MNKLRIWATVSLTLGIGGLVSLVLSFLAARDIFLGGENADRDWAVLRLASLVILLLVIATFISTRLVFKHSREKTTERVWATISTTLGIAGLIFLFLASLALTDIYHGEEDATLEWALLRLAFIVILAVIVANIICAGLALRHFRARDAEKDRRPSD